MRGNIPQRYTPLPPPTQKDIMPWLLKELQRIAAALAELEAEIAKSNPS